MMTTATQLITLLAAFLPLASLAAPQSQTAPKTKPNTGTRIYELWELAPAPNNGRSQWEATKSSNRPRSYDRDWERWSYPIGNGYTRVSIFGRTDTERVQITDKTLHNKGIYGKGGLTSFAELFLDFNQNGVKNYRRSLKLNEAIAHVSYEKDGVAYTREYFASYPEIERLLCDAVGIPRGRTAAGQARPRLGAVSFQHRFGSALNRHVHLHACVTDGVFEQVAAADDVRFHSARPLSASDLAAVTQRVRRRLVRWFCRQGFLRREAAADMLAWQHSGFSVDARVRISPDDQDVPGYYQSLEHLLRYCARPVFALERLSVVPGTGDQPERVCYALPRHKRATGWGRAVHGSQPVPRPAGWWN